MCHADQMGLDAYRAVLRVRDVRRVLLLGLVIRIPIWAASVILTLHVVTHLGRSYGASGALVGVATVALAVSAPWRGRRLDRVGLRATVAPSLVILAVCWSIAPFVSYWPLLLLAAVAGLFIVPSFSIVRQAVIHAVDDSQRRAALAIDSVVVEISFMIGPVLGVLLATYVPTSWALFACQFSSIAGGILLWIHNPPLRAEDPARPTAHRITARGWLPPAVGAVLVMSAAATIVLTGTDVGIVAALRHMHHQSWIGWELGVWGLGSAIGGFVYGALHRSIPVPVLLALLAGTTLPVIVARDAFAIAVFLFIAGLFCAPTITATVDALSRAVPERVLGEALGWHGSALTAGSAAGAPLAGIAIDRSGWHGGFILPSLLGLVAAAGGLLALRARGRLPDRPSPLITAEFDPDGSRINEEAIR
jgi:MFS family permease